MGWDIFGIDYCCSAELDNLNSNISEITNNDTIINENNRSIINEENTENILHNEDSERYDNEINMEQEQEQSLRSKGFLSGASSLYKKMYNTARRRFQWHIREQFKDKFDSYKKYKESWNPEIKFRNEIKNDVKRIQNNIDEKIEKIRHQKRIIVYFYTRKSRRRS